MSNEHLHSLKADGKQQEVPRFTRAGETPGRSRAAFSLVEILVTVALLSVIILGLVAMFGQTRRAFTSSMTQVDVLESGRSTMDMIVRELEQMTPANFGNVTNCLVEIPPNYTPLIQPLNTPTDLRTNILEGLFFLSSSNRFWNGVGYLVSTPNLGYGTLYKYTTNQIPVSSLWDMPNVFNTTTNLNRIADGVIHFRIMAYDTNGILLTNTFNNLGVQRDIDSRGVRANSYEYQFISNAVPAYVEVELGILEARTLERLRSMGGNPNLTTSFISNHAAQIHLFRQRIPIRNANPQAYK